MTSVHALVSPEFFDALTSHAKAKEAYERWQGVTLLLRGIYAPEGREIDLEGLIIQ